MPAPNTLSMITTSLLLAICTLAFIPSVADAQFSVDTKTGRIKDNFGRERIFHGWNVVWKTPPFLPNMTAFNPNTSFTDYDAQLLSSLGTNAIRLNVAWSGVYPINSTFVNITYLSQIRKIINTCKTYNIFVLVDFHQDAASERYCGNGKPIWLARNESTMNFPAPLGNGPMLPGCIKGTEPVCTANAITTSILNSMYLNNNTVAPYKFSNVSAVPDPGNQCWSFYFYENYLSYAISRSFQNLYSNTSQTDHFINYWTTVARNLRNMTNLLGYEIINEPWMGWYPDALAKLNPLDVIAKGNGYVLDALSKYAGTNLAPFYEKVMRAIQNVDSHKLIFWESVTFDNERPIPFNVTPAGNLTKKVLSYHYYQSEFEVVDHEKFIAKRINDSMRLGGIGTFMTETYWNRGNLTMIDPYFTRVLDFCEERLQSWTLWQYKYMDRKDGATRGLFSNGTEANPTINHDLAKLVSRPYAQAVNGFTRSSFFNRTNGTYTLAYTANAQTFSSPPTVLFLNTQYHYNVTTMNVTTLPNRASGLQDFKMWIKRLLLSAAALAFVPSVADAQFSVDTSSGRIKDRFGRERIFHGWNVVWKTAPFHPNINTFNPNTSFTEYDAQLLSSLGTNSIRLNVAWSGVYPSNGTFVNTTYLEQIRKIINICEANNIFVLVDFHQDAGSARYCGNGKPLWLARHENPLAFPAPLGNGPMIPGCVKGTEPVCTANAITTAMLNSMALNNKTVAQYRYDNWSPTPTPSSQCWAFWFFQNNLSYGVSRSFQNLYDNVNGQTDHFINYWTTVAASLKDLPNLIGYEIINEPWLGWYPEALSKLSMSELQLKGPEYVLEALSKFAGANLAPFYEKVMNAIQAVDSEKLIFWESTTLDNERPIPFNSTPAGNLAKKVLSYHYYQTEFEVVNHERFITQRMRDSKRLGGIGSFMTETYWNKGGTTSVDPYFPNVLDFCDRNLQSWQLWQYKFMDRKDGASRGLWSGGPQSDPVINEDLAKQVSRPYAPAVAGFTLLSLFNRNNGTYTLSYTATPHLISEPTLIFLNTKYHYPNGEFNLMTLPSPSSGVVRTSFDLASQMLSVQVVATRAVNVTKTTGKLIPLISHCVYDKNGYKKVFRARESHSLICNHARIQRTHYYIYGRDATITNFGSDFPSAISIQIGTSISRNVQQVQQEGHTVKAVRGLLEEMKNLVGTPASFCASSSFAMIADSTVVTPPSSTSPAPVTDKNDSVDDFATLSLATATTVASED
ncbi:hypothetical protein HDV05_004748 [Chytridiales sp. JEL 0842]|nr:hypothetical protein HDV05_004748 [Chytridiales sp. JEL 0842]